MSEPLARPVPVERLPREQAQGWRRWKLQDLLPPSAPPEPAPDETDRAAEAEAHARACAAERAAARQKGYTEGQAAGHTAGEAAGHAAGLESGYAAGHSEGLAAGRAAAEAQALRLAQLVDNFSLALERLHDDMGNALTDLALRVARDVLRTELHTRRDTVNGVLQEVLHVEADVQGPVRVYLHPEDATLVQESLGATLAEYRWRLVPEPTLAVGDCRVETALGEIDATLTTRWRQVVSAIGRDIPWQDS